MKEHGDGHGADAARDGSDVSCNVRYILKIDVAYECAIGEAIDSYVDDCGPFFHHFLFNEEGAPHRSDQNVGRAGEGGEVFRFAMGDGDGGVAVGLFLHEDGCEGFAHCVASPYDDDMFSFHGNPILF